MIHRSISIVCLTILYLHLTPVKCQACDGILPENKLFIPVDAKEISRVSQNIFNQVLDRLEQIYAPIIRRQWGQLKIERDWEDGRVNAYAQRKGLTWLINIKGGLARHPIINKDGLVLVACHEIGHHLGGAPKKSDTTKKTTWASMEGQADYFSTSKCMREFFADENNQAVVETLDVPAQVTQKCQASFNQAEAVAICQRSSLAGKNLATLFWAVSSFGNKPNFHTPDTTEVEQTKQTHPEPQCRLDTYFQGSLCDKEKSEPISNNNASKGYCTRHDHYLQGTRPLCWYRPNEFNF